MNEAFRYYTLALTFVPRRLKIDLNIKDISVKKGWYMNCLTYFPMCNEKYYESAD